jgi:hypothetical protein
VTAKTKAGKKTGGKKTSAERRALIMWALLACENAGAFQNELKPEPLKADRETLDEAGLTSWWTVGRNRLSLAAEPKNARQEVVVRLRIRNRQPILRKAQRHPKWAQKVQNRRLNRRAERAFYPWGSASSAGNAVIAFSSTLRSSPDMSPSLQGRAPARPCC